MVFIGIDAGTHTGVAVWDGGRFVSVETLPLWRALRYVEEAAAAYGKDRVFVVVEDARQRRWYPDMGSASRNKGRLMGAGSVRRDSAVWEEMLRDNGIVHKLIPPRKGLTKLSAEAFARLTGYEGRTSEHARDAAMLVFGRQNSGDLYF